MLFLSLCLVPLVLSGQINYTANDQVPTYDGRFRPGVNLGEYSGFSEIELALLAAGNGTAAVPGVGGKALRPGLFGSYVEQFGYETQLPNYQAFADLGVTDHTLIVGFPDDPQREPTFYCSDHQSTLYANLYEPIWDDNNGTAINEDNYYAAYLYRLVTTYQDYVQFWEIWNEPGFDYTSARGWLPPGAPGNWWDNNPDPCDYKLRAPIFHYVRLLRISYEVIKSIDPEAYVVVSGTGYASFLDAILRNTDNPLDGSFSAEFPLGGGAYFDVMGYHSYPHFDGSLRRWNDDLQDWEYFRHSDAAAEGVLATRDTFQQVLADYGYDGQTYPKKEWAITEVNLPRKEFGEYIGSAEAQRNFILKAATRCKQNDIWQMQVYKLAEDQTYDNAGFEFDLMGLYKTIDPAGGLYQNRNEEGIAMATFTELIYELDYSDFLTQQLDLPEGVGGAVFVDQFQNPTRVLWAETATDQSEAALATYTLPDGTRHLLRRWDYNQTREIDHHTEAEIELTGTPVFLTESKITANALTGCAPFQWALQLEDIPNADSYIWYFGGDGTPVTSQIQSPTISFFQPGSYTATLNVFDADGDLIHAEVLEAEVLAAPDATLTHSISGPIVNFTAVGNSSTTGFLWNFGDGSSSAEPTPQHVYFQSGSYEVTLTASGFCGEEIIPITLEVVVPSENPDLVTAQEEVPEYSGRFRPGVLAGYYPGWTDEQIANALAGNPQLPETEGKTAGIRALRSPLGHSFITGWSPEIELPTYQHYQNLNISDNVMTLGLPSLSVQDTFEHCMVVNSKLFRDLYLDIWDDGENGTPVNDDNPFARYVYDLVSTYSGHVKFYEIYSTPDYDLSGDFGWLPPGDTGNWWENDPTPCQLEMGAPVEFYIRTLRIAYEIIKTHDPDAYVTVSGLGYPSFLDVLLRKTDNPLDGTVAPGYPRTGGAYFDAIGFKSYPHIDGTTKYYDTELGAFAYERHSDAAAAGIERLHAEFLDVLQERGYDGGDYPTKEFIVSEANVPRAVFSDFIGGEEVQRNWIMKAYVMASRSGIRQLHLSRVAEAQPWWNAENENDVMGLFESLLNVSPYEHEPTPEATALATLTRHLFALEFDETRTELLDLPEEVDGAAYRDPDGSYVYVLWAKTTQDQSEVATSNYDLPTAVFSGMLQRYEWDAAQTGASEEIASTDIALSATPILLAETTSIATPPLSVVLTEGTEICPGESVIFEHAATDAESYFWSFPGGTPSTSTEENPAISYDQSGTYSASLTTSNAYGSHTATIQNAVEVTPPVVADFSYTLDLPFVFFEQNASNFSDLTWIFPNGNTASAYNPTEYFFENGSYSVTLVAENACGSDTITQIIEVASAPIADFAFNQFTDCTPGGQFATIAALSPETHTWTFEGGTPATSSLAFPQIIFPGPGVYTVEYIAANAFGADTISREVTIQGESSELLELDLCGNSSIVINGTVYDADNPEGVELLLNANEVGCDSTVIVAISIVDFYENFLIDTIQQGEFVEVGSSIYGETGMYIDTLQSVAGCDSIVHLNLTVLTTSTHEPKLALEDLRVHPNPFLAEFWIEFDLSQSQYLSVELTDVAGRTYAAKERLFYQTGRHRIGLNGKPWPPGVYFIRLRGEQGSATLRIVK